MVFGSFVSLPWGEVSFFSLVVSSMQGRVSGSLILFGFIVSLVDIGARNENILPDSSDLLGSGELRALFLGSISKEPL